MLIEVLLNIITIVVTDLFNYLPDIPAIPSDIQSTINGFFNMLTNAINCIGLFCDLKLVCLLMPVVLVIETFDKGYKLFMWALRKAPFLGIK